MVTTKRTSKLRITVEKLTVGDAVEAVLVELEAVRTEAGRLGRVGGQLRRRCADVRAAAVEREAEVGGVGLPVRVVHVHHHRDLFLLYRKNVNEAWQWSKAKSTKR